MNQPLSMTCFGRGEAVDGDRTWVFEVKSVNHRYCDISIRMPRMYTVLEERIRKEVVGGFQPGPYRCHPFLPRFVIVGQQAGVE